MCKGCPAYDLQMTVSEVFNGMNPRQVRAELDRNQRALQAALILERLQDAADRLPAELSGGMRKRVALARAMALDPQLLLCDEPSAGLDPVTAAELDALLLQLRERFGMTLVVVSHELASIEAIADRVLMLDGGQVIADGPLGEVKRLDDRRLQVFFGRQPRSIEGRSGRSSVFDMLTGTARREP